MVDLRKRSSNDKTVVCPRFRLTFDPMKRNLFLTRNNVAQKLTTSTMPDAQKSTVENPLVGA